MPATTTRRARPQSRPSAPQFHVPGGLVGDVAKFLISRSILKRVVRVGGIQGMLLSAAATYALDRFLEKRRR